MESVKRPRQRSAISWLVFALGFLMGLIWLVLAGDVWLERGWPISSIIWFKVIGPSFPGLVFMAASLMALRDRRRAGICFLASAPIAAFLLGFPDAGYWYNSADGGFYRESPALSTAIALACIFYLPILALFLGFWNKKRAMYLYAISLILAGIVFATSRWSGVLVPIFALKPLPFALFGAFWLFTYKYRWAPLFEVRPRSARRRWAVVLAQCVMIASLYLGGTLAQIVFYSTINQIGDCRGPGLFAGPTQDGHAAFTARLIWVGHQAKVSGRWAGQWAIGAVEEHFFGLPGWKSHFVLLTNHVFWEGETFFISGQDPRNVASLFLPLVNAEPCFGGARPVRDAELNLRVLRNPPSAGEMRIIGIVQGTKLPWVVPNSQTSEDLFAWVLNPPVTHTPVPNARVSVTASSGTTSIWTIDQKGIYEATGLPPDDYTVKLLDLPANQVAGDQRVEKKNLIPSKAVQLNFDLNWDGSIAGSIKDVTGAAALAALQLVNTDGTVSNSVDSPWGHVGPAGTFQFNGLPPGSRYLVRMNPFGPYKDSPYAPRYFPSAGRPQDARVLEITAQDPNVKNVDFIVRKLDERTLRIHATWPTGKPVNEGFVNVAYEHTNDWDAPSSSTQFFQTDASGDAEIHVFGDARIRVVAKGYVDDSFSSRHSPVVELDAAKLPQRLDLILSSEVSRGLR